MRLQLTALIALIIAGLLGPRVARADEGTISVRGAYYKERSTRVAQPMVDADLEAGEAGRLTGHFLIDSITSASVAAGAAGDAFTETRYEVGLNYVHELTGFRLGGGGRLSYEPDYLSGFVSLRGEMDLAEKNAILGLAVAQGRDAISNAGLVGGMAPDINGTLHTSLASASFTQILTPNLVGALTYDFIYLRGYQENVYRAVAAGGSFEPERVPNRRYRNAIFGSVRGYVEPTGTTIVGGYRFYADNWGILGHTPEVRVIQEVVPELDVHARYRYYRQSSADFYKDIYDTADPAVEPFITADEKLKKQTTQAFGAKVTSALSVLGVRGRWAPSRVELKLEYTTQTTSFGNAIAAQVAFTTPIEY